MNRFRWLPALYSFALILASVSAQAGEETGEAAAEAEIQRERVSGLVDEVLDGAAVDESLADWTRSVIGNALERAGGMTRETVPDSPLPSGSLPSSLSAERKAGIVMKGLASRKGTAEVLVFMSLSVPRRSWEEWAEEAARAGVPLVLRGVLPGEEGETGSLKHTVREVGKRLGGHAAGVAIDPRLFRLFGVERVPAVAVVPGGVPACASRGCAEDPPPPHDIVGGNIGLAAALEAVAAEGGPGRQTARVFLESLATGE